MITPEEKVVFLSILDELNKEWDKQHPYRTPNYQELDLWLKDKLSIEEQ